MSQNLTSGPTTVIMVNGRIHKSGLARYDDRYCQEALTVDTEGLHRIVYVNRKSDPIPHEAGYSQLSTGGLIMLIEA